MRRLLVSGGALGAVAAMSLGGWTAASADTATYTVTHRGHTITCTVTYTDVNGNQRLDWRDRVTAISCVRT